VERLTDGVHPAIHRDQYDAIERINYSTLRWMGRSPAHVQNALVTPPEDTDALKLGRVAHVAVFEPQRFRNMVAVWDGEARRGKDWLAFVERNRDRELLTLAEYEMCLALQKAVRDDVVARQYITGGHGEVTLLWTHAVEGQGVNSYRLGCKGRIDFDTRTGIADLKTTRDASPEAFRRLSWSYGYHVSAAWYADGYARANKCEPPPFRIVAVEKQPPWNVVVYRVNEKLMRLGRQKYSQWMDRLAFCRETSRWPGYAETEVELEPPAWVEPDDDIEALDLEVGGR
jgi:exodeoxyribonuclease VIII